MGTYLWFVIEPPMTHGTRLTIVDGNGNDQNAERFPSHYGQWPSFLFFPTFATIRVFPIFFRK